MIASLSLSLSLSLSARNRQSCGPVSRKGRFESGRAVYDGKETRVKIAIPEFNLSANTRKAGRLSEVWALALAFVESLF